MRYIKFCSFQYVGKHLPIEKSGFFIILIAKKDAHCLMECGVFFVFKGTAIQKEDRKE